MYNLNFNLINMMFIMSCLMFSYFFKHLLLTLISLEFIMLNLSYTIFISMSQLNFNYYFMSLYLTMMICESIMGLSILIFLVRLSGNDYFKSMNLILW